MFFFAIFNYFQYIGSLYVWLIQDVVNARKAAYVAQRVNFIYPLGVFVHFNESTRKTSSIQDPSGEAEVRMQLRIPQGCLPGSPASPLRFR